MQAYKFGLWGSVLAFSIAAAGFLAGDPAFSRDQSPGEFPYQRPYSNRGKAPYRLLWQQSADCEGIKALLNGSPGPGFAYADWQAHKPASVTAVDEQLGISPENRDRFRFSEFSAGGKPYVFIRKTQEDDFTSWDRVNIVYEHFIGKIADDGRSFNGVADGIVRLEADNAMRFGSEGQVRVVCKSCAMGHAEKKIGMRHQHVETDIVKTDTEVYQLYRIYPAEYATVWKLQSLRLTPNSTVVPTGAATCTFRR